MQKKKVARIVLSVAFEFAKIGAAIISAWLVSLWAIPFAIRERGYIGAVGGEWLLILFIFSITYFGLDIALEKLKGSD